MSLWRDAVYEPTSGRYMIPSEHRIDLRPGAVNYVSTYRDADDYAQAVVEGRASTKKYPDLSRG